MAANFYYGTGRRKTAVARVFLKAGNGKFVVNDKPVEIAENIVADLKKLGVPARLDLFEEGGHGFGVRPTIGLSLIHI